MSVKLMIVDDEQEIRDMLVRHFQFLGYDPIAAANGRKALELLTHRRVDVAITDLLMPEMDGIELLAQLKRDWPMIQVIVITGYVSQENALSCMRFGAETFIFKPLEDLAELEQAVRRAERKLDNWRRILRVLRSMGP